MGARSVTRLTDQQQAAVETRDVSVALSAGAGCGKTHVLVERYLSHLAPGGGDGLPATEALGGLIAITFTDRAAREMRDRVRRACRERSQAADEAAQSEAWHTLLRELEGARISTIHAFCASLLRSHAVEAGIDPRFEILQAAQAETLFSELIDDGLREQLGRRHEDLLGLAVTFGLRPLRDMIVYLLGRRHEIDFDRYAAMTGEQLVAAWQQIEREQILPALHAEFMALAEVGMIRKIIHAWQPEHPKLVERFAALREQFAALDDGAELLPALRVIRENAVVQYVKESYWFSPEAYADFRDAAKALREWIDDTGGKLGIDAESALDSARAGLALLRVARPVIESYEARKSELGMLDFDDLLRRTRDLLEGPHGDRILKHLSGRLVLLLVDEFQDTDRLQVELVRLLCGKGLTAGKLFFVGDAKQSIYRFRGADPQVFRDLRADMPAASRLPLTKNFRSQPAILDFVNALFCERLGPQYEPLEADRPSLAAAPHIEFLWAVDPPASEEAEKENAESRRRHEAEWIARRLGAIFASGEVPVRDKGTRQPRAAQPGDVAILFRSLSDVQYYETALRRHGIPYYLVGGSAFYAQQEVYDLLNLLRTVQDAHDTVSLAGVLRSPFFSLTDETLFWLSTHAAGIARGLFDTSIAAALGDEQQRRQVRAAAETIAALRERKDRLPVAELIREALARTGYDATLLADFLGERKLANLRKLLDQARAADQSGIFTLADYIHQLAQFVARQPDEPSAPIEPESSTVVRLMTIHQAKGLEFPLVVVPDLARSPGGQKGSLAFNADFGPMVRATERKKGGGPCGLDLFRYLERNEDADEEARLLYVATTRAADHLILSAGLQDIDKPKGGWLSLIATRFDLHSGKFQATLPAGYALPQVAAITEEPPLAARHEQGDEHVDPAAAAAAARDSAAAGQGVVPALVAPIAVDSAARRTFSFSRLSGEIGGADLSAAADQSAEIEGMAAPATIDTGRAARIATEVAGTLAPARDESEGDATALGTFVHRLLAQLDFAAPGNVAELCRRELERSFAAPTFEPAAAIELLERFLRSPRAAALREAKAVYSELEFLYAVPTGATDGEPRMIGGFIDCLYQNANGAWVIVDFKTNRATPATVPQVATGYELQMCMYALAAEEVLGRSPESLVLHFLRPGVEHAVPWSAALRERTFAKVTRAIAEAAT